MKNQYPCKTKLAGLHSFSQQRPGFTMKKIKNSDKYCDNDNVYKAQFLTKNTA